MPNLKELQNPDVKKAFIDKVAAKASKSKDDIASLNHGISNNKELLDRFEKGDQIDFNYKRILDDAEKFE